MVDIALSVFRSKAAARTVACVEGRSETIVHAGSFKTELTAGRRGGFAATACRLRSSSSSRDVRAPPREGKSRADANAPAAGRDVLFTVK
jgi:hypothetical protein